MTSAQPTSRTDGDPSGPLSHAIQRLTGETPAAALARRLSPPDSALPVPAATDRKVWDRDSGTIDLLSFDRIAAVAKQDRATAWPTPTASLAAAYHRTGDRSAWEHRTFERIERTARAALVAAVTQQDQWIDEVADGVWMLLEQSTWCWPAHDLFTGGTVLTDVARPRIDLGAGEMVATLAWLDQLLGAQLDRRIPGLRSRIRAEARRRIFDPFLATEDWWWLGHERPVNNWNPWILGNLLVAGLRLLDDPTEEALRHRVVTRAVTGMDPYIASLPTDGAIDEGIDYWWAGACRALEALEILRYATGGDLHLIPELPALRATLSYPHSMHLGGSWYYSVADGQATSPDVHPWHSLYRVARASGATDAASFAAGQRIPGHAAGERFGFGRLLQAIIDPDWQQPEDHGPPLPRDVFYPSLGVFLARRDAGSSRGLTLAAKGGHNDEQHNHNDLGSVMVASDGIPVLVDPGRPRYTAATFGPDRYQLWMMQSSWHSAPEVAGAAQLPGREHHARVTRCETTDTASSFEIDLTAAYPVDALLCWSRRTRLDRTSGTVTIDDDWAFSDTAPSADVGAGTRIHYIVAGRLIRCDTESAVRIDPLHGAPAVLVRWPAGLEMTITEMTIDDPLLTRVWGDRLSRIEIHVDQARSCTVQIEQVDDQEVA